MREDVKDYQIFSTKPFGYYVRRNFKNGKYEWMGSYSGTCSAGDFGFRHMLFFTKWGARRSIRLDKLPRPCKPVETISK